MSRRRVCPLLALTLALAVPVAAHDRYESDLGLSFPDDTFATYVELLHGQVQSHDLEATTPADQDWTFVQEALRHSYEVTVMNTALRFASAPTAGFATMNRVDELGKILTPGAVTNAFDGVFSARWIVTSPQPFGYSYVRVEGFESLGPDSGYDIQVKDTTYSLPRWNNNGTQVTVFLLQNTTDRTVNGSLYFYDPAGANIHTHPLQLGPYQLVILNTAGIPEIAGLSGSATIAHDGRYGCLSGKAVALESSTGFSFDTPLVPIPY